MHKSIAGLISAILMGVPLPSVAQSDAPPPIGEGVFTAEQAERGHDGYMLFCAACHGVELVSAESSAPTLTAPRFRIDWQGRTLGERFERIRTSMPTGSPGILTDEEYVDVIAFILQFNGYPAGDRELIADPAYLEAIVISPP